MMNKVIIAGALVGGALLIKRGLDYNALSKNVTVDLYKARIHSVSLSGIIFATGVRIKNPVNIQVSITKPTISLTTNGSLLGSSPVENKTVKIKGLSETDLGTLQLTLPWLPLIQFIGTGFNLSKILEAWKTKNAATLAKAIKLPIEIAVSLYVDSTMFIKTKPIKIN